MAAPEIDAQARKAAFDATMRAGPQEICGLFVRDKKSGTYHFIACKNQATNPQTHFEISEAEFAPYRHRDDVIIVHSHPQGPNYPSVADLSLAQTTGLTCALIAPLLKTSKQGDDAAYELIFYGPPCLASLTSRIYRHGVTDCFGYMRDVFAQDYQIIVPDMPREWGWWEGGDNFYQDHFAAYGFEMLDEAADLQKGDVFIARLRANVDNHGGIYWGHGLIKHHLAGRAPVDRGRLVTEEPIARMQPFIRYWLRHKSLQKGGAR